MTTKTETAKYEVKGVKSFEGHDGYGFNATLYRDGTKVATVVELANGGEMDIRWIDGPESRSKEFKILTTYVDTLPPQEFMGDMMEVTIDTFICSLVDSYENTQRLKRLCRQKTLIRLDDCKEGDFYALKIKFSPAVAEKVRVKYGNKLVEIVNERYI